jgi:DNA-directed RNA polymerase subunit RPC12/RpoP
VVEYVCKTCGMGVKGLSCVKCGKELVHTTIEKNGAQIHVSKCPEGHGMIKSPMCCGQDMSCSV